VIIVNDEKLSKTQRELETILDRFAAATGGRLREVKSSARGCCAGTERHASAAVSR
jgi:hypothetical protein